MIPKYQSTHSLLYLDLQHKDGTLNTISNHPYFEGKCYYTNSVNINEDQPSDDNITIYPNPANEIIRITGLEENKIYQYLIYGSFGRRIVNEMMGSTDVIDISTFPEGFYFFEILSGDKRTSKRFLKE